MAIPRKPRTTRYVRSGDKGIRSSYPTKVSTGRMPLRTRSGRKTIRKNKRVSKMLTPYAESKLSGVSSLNEASPSSIALGAQAYKYTFCLGNFTPGTWGGFGALGGFAYPQGVDITSRVGNYMYLKNTTLNLSVHMNQTIDHQMPTQFRMIVFRARRASSPAGVNYNPDQTLFLNQTGDRFGAGTALVNGNDLMLQPLNRRDWIIVSDKRFTLQNQLQPESSVTARGGVFYPTYKMFRINLKHNAKVHFSTGSSEPNDFDFHYGVAIYAARIGRDQNATGWEVNLRGTTSANDL